MAGTVMMSGACCMRSAEIGALVWPKSIVPSARLFTLASVLPMKYLSTNREAG
jgi:hypothetical protein